MGDFENVWNRIATRELANFDATVGKAVAARSAMLALLLNCASAARGAAARGVALKAGELVDMSGDSVFIESSGYRVSFVRKESNDYILQMLGSIPCPGLNAKTLARVPIESDIAKIPAWAQVLVEGALETVLTAR